MRIEIDRGALPTTMNLTEKTKKILMRTFDIKLNIKILLE